MSTNPLYEFNCGSRHEGGYLHNCYLMPKAGETGMFRVSPSPEHYLTAHLDGYAVIPLEEYERLKSLDRQEVSA